MNMIDVFGKLHDFISTPILFAIFGLVCIFFGVSSLVLLFHWNKYAVDKTVVITAQSIFFLGGFFILLIGFISILLY